MGSHQHRPRSTALAGGGGSTAGFSFVPGGAGGGESGESAAYYGGSGGTQDGPGLNFYMYSQEMRGSKV